MTFARGRAWRVGAALLLAGLLLVVRLSSGELALWLAPYQAPLTGAGDSLSHLASLSEENERLRARVAELESKQARQAALPLENERLTALLHLKQHRFSGGIAANLASRDANGWFSQVVFDRGGRDGVGLDMVAVAADGLVGRVEQVAGHGCRVRLLVANGSAVPIMLARTGAVGILYGNGGYTCQIKFVSHDVEVHEGEEVLTSGLGDVYPGGVLVGRVIRNYGRTEALFQSLEVEPAVDFGRLRQALLVSRSPE